MTAARQTPPASAPPSGMKPLTEGQKGPAEQIALYVCVIRPFAAVAAAVPLLWGRGIGWHDVVLGLVFYIVSGLGVTVGFHRYLTHGGFKARRPMRVALAVAGSLSLEGSVVRWVAD